MVRSLCVQIIRVNTVLYKERIFSPWELAVASQPATLLRKQLTNEEGLQPKYSRASMETARADYYLQGRQFLWLPVLFPVLQVPSKKGSTLKEKAFLHFPKKHGSATPDLTNKKHIFFPKFTLLQRVDTLNFQNGDKQFWQSSVPWEHISFP